MSAQCKTCDKGSMQRKKIYRMSGVVVFIGYILLIPSILGVLGSAAMAALSMAGGAAAATAELDSKSFDDLRANKIPEAVITKLRRGNAITEDDLQGLNQDQRDKVKLQESALIMGRGGAAGVAALGAGMFICMGVSCLVSGLLGWLLVMKRWVLQCTNCMAVVESA